eukprot:374524_1
MFAQAVAIAQRLKSRALPNMFKRQMTTATAETGTIQTYSKGTKWLHISMAAGILGCFGTVQYQQNTTDKEMKGKAMFYHKSIGLLVGMAMVPRLALRFASKVPSPLPGSPLEHMAAKASHIAFYGFLTVMPVT